MSMIDAHPSVELKQNNENTAKQTTNWNEVKNKLRECNLQNTKFFDTAKSYGLTGEIKEVEPTLKELDFYGGYRCPEHDYQPHSMHTVHDKNQDVTLTDVLEKFEEGHLAFVGPAGIGKTTLMKRIARKVVNKQISCFKDIEIVLYIEGKNINFGAFTTAGEMLTLGTTLDKAEVDQITQFARCFPKKVLCVIDSLDTLSRSLDGVYTSIIDEERAHPEVILWHLLAGQLFPGCRIITSSREHAIRNYKGELRANKVIVMTGLSRESMGEMIFGYLGETEGEKELEHLETKCPTVFALCRTPVFLVYTVIARTYDPKFKPTTLSGIMILLQKLIRSEHVHEENINHVIDQLKLLALHGTENKRVLFTIAELKDHNLEPDQVTDLAVIAPGGKLLEKEHDYVFFSHQSMQELSAALAIAEMETKDFESFLLKSLHLPHYAMVRRLLCGLLLDKGVQEASEKIMKACSEDKKNFLKQSLKTQLSDVEQGTRDLLELFISLSEAKEGVTDVISSTVHEISLVNTPHSKSDVYAIGSVAKQCTVLNNLTLRRCGIESASLEILDSCLAGSNVKIQSLDLSGNDLTIEGTQSLVRLVAHCHISELRLDECKINEGQLGTWARSVGSLKISSWEMEDWTLDNSAAAELGKLLKLHSPQEFKLEKCQMGADAFACFVKNIGNPEEDVMNARPFFHSPSITIRRFELMKGESQISSLDLSNNHDLSDDDMSSVGALTKLCRINNLDFSNCHLTRTNLLAFKNSASDTKISSLSLGSYGKCMSADALQTLEEVTRQCRVDYLVLRMDKPAAITRMDALHSVTNDQVRAVADLLPHVNKEISLLSWRLTDAGKRYLKSALDKLYPTNLVIKLDEEEVRSEKSFRETEDQNHFRHYEALVEVQCNNMQEGKLSRIENPYFNHTTFLERQTGGIQISQEFLTIKMDWANERGSSQDIDEETDDATRRIDGKEEDLASETISNLSESLQNTASEDEKSDEIMSSISIESPEPDQLDQDGKSLEFRYRTLRRKDHKKILDVLKNEQSLQEMRIRDCDLKDSFFSEINRNESRCKIKHLDVSGNEHLRNFNMIKAFMKHHEVSSLNVSECELNDQDLQSMEEQFRELEFAALDVSYNTFGDGFSSLGSTVQMCRIEELDILECGLNTQHLISFQAAVGNHKIKRIDMSYNSDVCEEGFEILADLIATCEISQISLSGCEITGQKMERFCRKLEILTPVIEKLDVSYNDEMDTEAMTSLAEIVRLCKVSNLNVSGCGLTRTIVKEMNKELIHSCKIKVLSMRDNKLLLDGITDVARLAVACSVEELDISRCFWKAKHINDFISTIGEHKFQVLDISEPDWIPDEDYTSAMKKLESHVEGKFIGKNAK